MASKVFSHLVQLGVMKPIGDPSLDSGQADEEGVFPSFTAGPIRMVKIGFGTGFLSVPIFMKLFRRLDKSRARYCDGCSRLQSEIKYGSIDDWAAAKLPLHGDWMWQVLVFPTKLDEECGHRSEYCSDCLRKHIEAKMEEQGRDVVGRLTCPSAICRRVLRYEEIKLYADEAVMKRYEKKHQLWFTPGLRYEVPKLKSHGSFRIMHPPGPWLN